MPQRLVLDTNVWLDWLVFADAALDPLRAMVSDHEAEIVIDAACEHELERVLGYPLQRWTLSPARQQECLEQCRRIARRLDCEAAMALPRCADPDDQKFLELAARGEARWLLTKDHALLGMARRKPPLPFHIVTPAMFNSRHGVE